MTEQDLRVFEHLSQFVTENKKQLVERVLQSRTHQVTVVLEDIYQSQNASAVVRTCECMGIQNIHIIEQQAKYEINRRVLKGANKWMELHRYRGSDDNNTAACFQTLREAGYRILAADPEEGGRSIHDIDPTEQKTALLFGNELRGVSGYALQHCDERVRIPMYGFTESLNISVSVAICLNTLITRLHEAGESYFLSEAERQQLRLAWYRKIVRRSELIEREFLKAIE